MSDGLITLNTAVWAIFIGIVAAVIYTAVQKSTLNLFITSLCKNGCFDSESAKTLAQLGICSKFRQKIILSAAKTNTGLNRILGVCTKRAIKNFGELPKSNFTDSDLFFIDREQSEAAEAKYKFKKSNPLYTALLIIALALAAAVACTVITWLNGFAKSSFKNFGTSSSDKTISSDTASDNVPEQEENSDGNDQAANNGDGTDDSGLSQSNVSDGSENDLQNGENETSGADGNSSEGAVIPKPNPTIPQPNFN